jgi:hypothetical protein
MSIQNGHPMRAAVRNCTIERCRSATFAFWPSSRSVRALTQKRARHSCDDLLWRQVLPEYFVDLPEHPSHQERGLPWIDALNACHAFLPLDRLF